MTMKMKKIVLSMFVGCMVIFGCSSCTVDKGHTTYYTYVNQTASTITIECYYGDGWVEEIVNPDDLYETLTIQPGDKSTVKLYAMVFCLPFRWLNSPDVYLLVHNGQIKVFDDESADDSLLIMETYTLTSESETVRHYEYVFTDDYFKDGEPIE